MKSEDTEVGIGYHLLTHTFRPLEFFCYFLFAIGPLVGNAVLVLSGAIATDFSINPTQALIAVPAFMFPFAFAQLFSGAVSDIYGRVRVAVLGSLVFALGLIIIVYSSSLQEFIWGNVVAGSGFAFVNPVVLALLSDLSTFEGIPRRMGIASALASLSAGLGPFLAGQLVVFGWEFYYLVFFAIVVIILISISVIPRPNREVHRGSELRTFLVNLASEFRKPVVLLMLGATFLVALTYLGALVWTSRALIGNLSESLLGFILLGAGIAGATAGSLLGSMIRRWGPGRPILLGLVSNFIGLGLFMLIGDVTLASAVPFDTVALVAVGWAGGLLFPMTITYGQIISPKRHGVLAGAVTSSFFFGSALVLQLFDPLFEIGVGTVYAGLLVASIVLAFLFYGLYRSLQSEL
jgi:DHA1 family multidrug resistance protein-like MFS transporter